MKVTLSILGLLAYSQAHKLHQNKSIWEELAEEVDENLVKSINVDDIPGVENLKPTPSSLAVGSAYAREPEKEDEEHLSIIDIKQRLNKAEHMANVDEFLTKKQNSMQQFYALKSQQQIK